MPETLNDFLVHEPDAIVSLAAASVTKIDAPSNGTNAEPALNATAANADKAIERNVIVVFLKLDEADQMRNCIREIH